jgi:hypothetical protein
MKPWTIKAPGTSENKAQGQAGSPVRSQHSKTDGKFDPINPKSTLSTTGAYFRRQRTHIHAFDGHRSHLEMLCPKYKPRPFVFPQISFGEEYVVSSKFRFANRGLEEKGIT